MPRALLPQLDTVGGTCTHGLTLRVRAVGWDRALLPQLSDDWYRATHGLAVGLRRGLGLLLCDEQSAGPIGPRRC